MQTEYRMEYLINGHLLSHLLEKSYAWKDF